MKKFLVISIMLLMVISSVFASIDVSGIDKDLAMPDDVKNVMSRAVKLIYVVGIIAAVLAVLLLGITTILGISVSDKLKTTLLRIFLGIAILALATFIVQSLGVTNGGVKGSASGAVVDFTPAEMLLESVSAAL